MKFTLILLISLSLCTLTDYTCEAQDFGQYQLTQFDINDGLPSNECHTIVQDDYGYIWIATDRGLTRFDGYEFKTYGLENGLKDLSCMQIQIDDQNDIWIWTFSGDFYIYRQQEDTIIPYPFNDLLKQASKDSWYLDFYVQHENLIVSAGIRGYIIIDSKGVLTPHQKISESPYNGFLNWEGKLQWYNSSTRLPKTEYIYEYAKGLSSIKSKLLHGNEMFELLYRPDHQFLSHPKGFSTEGYDYLYVLGHMYVFENQCLDTVFTIEGVHDMTFLDNGGILVGYLNHGGLKYFEDRKALKKGIFRTIVDSVSVTDILLIEDDILLLSTLDHGMLMLKPLKIAPTNDRHIKGKNITSLAGNSLQELFITVNKNSVFKYQLDTDQSETIYQDHQGEVYDLFITQNQEYDLFIAGHPISKLIHSKHSNEFNNISPNIKYSSLKKIRNTKSKTILGVNTNRVQVLTDQELKELYNSHPKIPNLKALDAIDYQEGYLLACLDGLYYLEGYERMKLDSIHPFFELRINTIERFDGTYFLGSLGGGLAIWNEKSDVKVITTDEGLISNNVEQIVIDRSNRMVVCTKSGMSIIHMDQDTLIYNYKTNSGLPSNNINDAIIIHDTLVIATAQGLAYMELEDPKVSIPTPPMIEGIFVHNQRIKDQSHLTLSHKENNITIAYKLLDYTQESDIEYAYSLNNSPWEKTINTSVRFAQLSPDNYHFRVKVSDKHGKWSQPKSVHFKIGVPWWKSLGFFIFLGILHPLLFFLYTRYRIKRVRREAEIKQEINRLERAALSAQMNPHFIFNCLNSIQSYIIRNDIEVAMEYLSSFAKLIRQYLNASAQSSISLQEELFMLENYLALEQLKTQYSFTFSFNIAPTIEKDKIRIPPLLIQPVLENAIVHGLKNINSDGQITIKMRLDKSFLIVTVLDNGIGIEEKVSNTNHKSFGMSITEKRLKHLNNLDKNYIIRSRKDRPGVKVIMRIKTQ